MAETISLDNLEAHLAEVISRVREGESFLIEQQGRAVARIAPVEADQGPTLRELADRLDQVRTKDDSFATTLRAFRADPPRAEPPAWLSS